MDNIISLLFVMAITIFGALLVLGGITDSPWKFASQPYLWVFRTTKNIIKSILQELFGLLGAFYRRHPDAVVTIATILILGTIIIIAFGLYGLLLEVLFFCAKKLFPPFS